MAIKTFCCRDTEAFWGGARISRFQSIEKVAIRKLQVLNAATSINDLTAVPGNRLEKLKGDRSGQFSIRINDQWRLCFVWDVPDAHNVEITDHYKS